MAQAEPDLRVADKYMLHLLKGKCYDKQRQFKRAVLEYGQAIELAAEHANDDAVLGQLYFRIGWSIIRTKDEIDMGIDHLRKANTMLPENPEVMLKLAGVLFQESGTEADIEQSQQLLARLIEMEPNSAEAYLLQGKIFHKLGQLPEAVAALEKAV